MFVGSRKAKIAVRPSPAASTSPCSHVFYSYFSTWFVGLHAVNPHIIPPHQVSIAADSTPVSPVLQSFLLHVVVRTTHVLVPTFISIQCPFYYISRYIAFDGLLIQSAKSLLPLSFPTLLLLHVDEPIRTAMTHCSFQIHGRLALISFDMSRTDVCLRL
ncbi:hypothetical protein NEOLEDRAFT_755468 [Neolentinus lepideus HHB14362 ss-1]|uniref:Uncharacterized protein n=1 Tax=Neolentinus lepideus HHB14362 ss-1 TaxID=1314782 RepID=A0A165PQY9_9AGAM|nr:hypothetical protein NEOLEDRAFT_755468 [Neolentinus lepideus HHB14362 ss-1]